MTDRDITRHDIPDNVIIGSTDNNMTYIGGVPFHVSAESNVITGNAEPSYYSHVEGTTNPVINNQTAKADAGKPRLSLVPLQILYDIAAVREYAVNGKYKDPDNWKQVSVERYRDALMRHLCAYITDPDSKDEESGLPHLYHIACNVAFLCALEKENEVNHTVK